MRDRAVPTAPWAVAASALAGIILVALLPAAPASAAQATFTDTQDDVTYYDWETDQFYADQDWDEVDIRNVGVNATSTTIFMNTYVVDLVPGWWALAVHSYDVNNNGAADYDLVTGPDGQHRLLRADGSQVDCRGIQVSLDYGADVIATSVPRACFHDPASVRISSTLYDDEGFACDCNDFVLDVYPNTPGTVSAPIAFANPTYDPNGPTGTIYRLYRAYFLREPDKAGYDYWLSVYRQGYPLTDISENFSRSREFQSTYGNLDMPHFIQRVYLNVLDREPDPDGYNYWADQMANKGMPRGVVMINFSESAEFKSKTAGGRPPGY